MARCAVLDLGSNSFHLLVAERQDRRLVPVLREREMLHLGRALARHGHLPEAERRAAVTTVRHLAGLARRAGADELTAVATAALREAGDGGALLAELDEAAGAPVRVLDGCEEARLAYRGVRAAVAVRAEPLLVLDLGGGSLELALGEGVEVGRTASLPLGASRLSALVGPDRLGPDGLAAVERRVDRALAGLADELADPRPGEVVLVGGTVRALGRVAAAADGTWLPATLNQLPVATERLAGLARTLADMDRAARREVDGMKSRRADHLHVAGLVLVRVLQRLGIAHARVSDWGLREGLLLEVGGTRDVPTADVLRDDEVARLREAFVPDDPHPHHVRRLAGQLFDSLADVHGLAADDRSLLCQAAELHNVGEGLALRRQHLHGAYLVRNAELRGFDPTEQALLTTLVRFHRSRGLDDAYAPYASLGPGDRRRGELLLALLQLADTLDRAHDQAVTDVDARVEHDRLVLRLEGGGLHVTDEELSLRTRLARRVLGVEVAVDDPARP